MKTKPKALVKFNNGNGAILCSKCRVIIRAGGTMTDEDWEFASGKKDLDPQYCEDCKEKDGIKD